MEGQWFWGVVVRLDPVDDVLRSLERTVCGAGIHVQHVGTGHITLLYAPLRPEGSCASLAARARAAAATAAPFSVTLHGAGEFPTASRVVAWLAVESGIAELRTLRRALLDCVADVLPHPWIPHCTTLYAEDLTAYEPAQAGVRETLDEARVTATVDALWVAGFPASGHPASDLEYRLRIPLG